MRKIETSYTLADYRRVTLSLTDCSFPPQLPPLPLRTPLPQSPTANSASSELKSIPLEVR